MKNVLLAGLVYAGTTWIERVCHSVNPVIDKIMPAIGRSGKNGQRIIRSKLKMPPMIIITVPAIRSTRREKNPMIRETSLSKNM